MVVYCEWNGDVEGDWKLCEVCGGGVVGCVV